MEGAVSNGCEMLVALGTVGEREQVSEDVAEHHPASREAGERTSTIC